MSDLDHALRRLGELPVPSGLAEIDDEVFAGVQRKREEQLVSRRLMAATAAVALSVGIVGGGMLGTTTASAQPLSPFSPDSPLAPSTLLDLHP